MRKEEREGYETAVILRKMTILPRDGGALLSSQLVINNNWKRAKGRRGMIR